MNTNVFEYQNAPVLMLYNNIIVYVTIKAWKRAQFILA